jgi:myo-inositol 2-dehydrogenase / D-chiro-inositol 1-dehydrogenase
MKIAVIGTGNIARRHLGVLASQPDVELVGVVSPTPEHAGAAAQKWGGRPYTNHEALLRQEDVEAAWICVPPGAHGPLERDLIERGIPFFVEKPLSADRRTANEIASALQASGLVAGVGYHWRALDTIPEVRRVLADNPARMLIGAWHDAVPPPEWWRYQATSGGQMVEQATHLFDTARTLAGEARVMSATATRHGQAAYPKGDVADVSAALLRYDTGATGVYTATSLLGGLATAHLQLVCEGLLITITRDGVTYDTGKDRRRVPVGNDPFLDEDRAFLAAVARRDPGLLICSYAEALRTHRLCFDVLDASGYSPAPGEQKEP